MIDCITPVDQPRADHLTELILFVTLFGLPYEDAICQALTTQSNLTLQQVREAMVHVDTSAKLHLATKSVHPASASGCWKCDTHGHLASACLHGGTIKDVIAKHNAAQKEKPWKKKSKTLSSSLSSSTAAADASTTNDPPASEFASVVACFLTTAGPVSDNWLCNTGALCSMSSW